VCLTGRIPFREQLAEYTRCFANAAEYHAARLSPLLHVPNSAPRSQSVVENPVGHAAVSSSIPRATPSRDLVAVLPSWRTANTSSPPLSLSTPFKLPPLMGEDRKVGRARRHPLAKTEEYDQRSQPAAETTVKLSADDPWPVGYGRRWRSPPARTSAAVGGATAQPNQRPHHGGRVQRDRGAGCGHRIQVVPLLDFDVQPGKSYQYRAAVAGGPQLSQG
jgi:hypothetical protein